MQYVNNLNGRLTGLPVRILCKQQETDSTTTLSTSIIQVSLLPLLKPMTVRDHCSHSSPFNLVSLSPTVHLKKVWQVLPFKLASTLLIKEVERARKDSSGDRLPARSSTSEVFPKQDFNLCHTPSTGIYNLKSLSSLPPSLPTHFFSLKKKKNN